jgi:hypothetical protein
MKTNNYIKIMKTIILTVLALVTFSAISFAQTEKEDIAIAESIFGKAKKTIISEYVQIDAEKREAFWKLYDQYNEKSNAITLERLNLIKKYADNYANIDDPLATSLANDLISNNEKYDHLYKQYLGKFTKVIGGVKAATLFQVEFYIQTAMERKLQKRIPIIGQMPEVQN